jgi:NTE family protein
VRIDGRQYVDGGICSASNLDVVRRTDVDVVVCLNPMSSRPAAAPEGSIGDRLAALTRAEHGRRLGHEARKLRREGKHVVLLQAAPDDVAVMGPNFLSGRRRGLITAQAQRSVTAQLRELRARGDLLPAPSGPAGGGRIPRAA